MLSAPGRCDAINAIRFACPLLKIMDSAKLHLQQGTLGTLSAATTSAREQFPDSIYFREGLMMAVNLRKIEGNWDLGYALDKHMLSSTFTGHNEYGHPTLTISARTLERRSTN